MPDQHQFTKRVVLRMLHLFDDGTASCYGSDRFLDLIADDCNWAETSSDPHFAGRGGDKADLRRTTQQGKQAMRDRHADIAEIIAEDDRAAVRWTWSATSAGDGTRVAAEVYSTFTVSTGRITRWHDRIILDGSSDE